MPRLSFQRLLRRLPHGIHDIVVEEAVHEPDLQRSESVLRHQPHGTAVLKVEMLMMMLG